MKYTMTYRYSDTPDVVVKRQSNDRFYLIDKANTLARFHDEIVMYIQVVEVETGEVLFFWNGVE